MVLVQDTLIGITKAGGFAQLVLDLRHGLLVFFLCVKDVLKGNLTAEPLHVLLHDGVHVEVAEVVVKGERELVRRSCIHLHFERCVHRDALLQKVQFTDTANHFGVCGNLIRITEQDTFDLIVEAFFKPVFCILIGGLGHFFQRLFGQSLGGTLDVLCLDASVLHPHVAFDDLFDGVILRCCADVLTQMVGGVLKGIEVCLKVRAEVVVNLTPQLIVDGFPFLFNEVVSLCTEIVRRVLAYVDLFFPIAAHVLCGFFDFLGDIHQCRGFVSCILRVVVAHCHVVKGKLCAAAVNLLVGVHPRKTRVGVAKVRDSQPFDDGFFLLLTGKRFQLR